MYVSDPVLARTRDLKPSWHATLYGSGRAGPTIFSSHRRARAGLDDGGRTLWDIPERIDRIIARTST